MRVVLTLVGALALSFAIAAPAEAQLGPKRQTEPAIGENYVFEVQYLWWKPEIIGSVTSDRLDLVGSRVDLVNDLGFENDTKFRDWRFTFKPGRKHKIRFEYTPLKFKSEGVLTRDITFAGQTFPVSLPIESSLEWKVWRIGYEWDFISKSRGYMGVLGEVRKTQLSASLNSLAASGAVLAEAPLPAIGIVTRVYPLPDLAVHFEYSGMKVPDDAFGKDYGGVYTDMEVSATVNITKSLGVNVGWRRMNTDIRVNSDAGDLNFRGISFGAAVRF
jgi:hypothetical protein